MMLQIFQYKETFASILIFYIWTFFSGLFMALSLQTIILSLEIVLNLNQKEKGSLINKNSYFLINGMQIQLLPRRYKDHSVSGLFRT